MIPIINKTVPFKDIRIKNYSQDWFHVEDHSQRKTSGEIKGFQT